MSVSKCICLKGGIGREVGVVVSAEAAVGLRHPTWHSCACSLVQGWNSELALLRCVRCEMFALALGHAVRVSTLHTYAAPSVHLIREGWAAPASRLPSRPPRLTPDTWLLRGAQSRRPARSLAEQKMKKFFNHNLSPRRRNMLTSERPCRRWNVELLTRRVTAE